MISAERLKNLNEKYSSLDIAAYEALFIQEYNLFFVGTPYINKNSITTVEWNTEAKRILNSNPELSSDEVNERIKRNFENIFNYHFKHLVQKI